MWSDGKLVRSATNAQKKCLRTMRESCHITSETMSDVLKDYLVAGYYYCHYPLFGRIVPTKTPSIIEIDESF